MAAISSQGVHASCTRTPPATVPHFPNTQLTESRSSCSPITSWSTQCSSSPASASASSASCPDASDPICTSCPQYDPTKTHPAGATVNPRNIAASRGPNPSSPTSFLTKTYELVDDPDTDSVLSWSNEGTSFVVWSPPDLCRHLLPCNFKHSNFSSFRRQLNTSGFRKIVPDRWEFAHTEFQRGQRHLLEGIRRRASIQQPVPWLDNGADCSCSSSAMSSSGRSVNSRAEVEKESLKKEKNVIMREILRLQQKLQSKMGHLDTMWERLRMAETCQHHMISFIIKAMHNPAFLAQFQQLSSVQAAGNVVPHCFVPKRRGLRDIDQPPTMSSTDNCVVHPYKQKWVLAVRPEFREQVTALARLSGGNRYHATGAVISGPPLSCHQVFGEKYAAHRRPHPPVQDVDAGYGGLDVGDACSTYETDAPSASAGMEKLTKLHQKTT